MRREGTDASSNNGERHPVVGDEPSDRSMEVGLFGEEGED
jgi:hypothetical protein